MLGEPFGDQEPSFRIASQALPTSEMVTALAGLRYNTQLISALMIGLRITGLTLMHASDNERIIISPLTLEQLYRRPNADIMSTGNTHYMQLNQDQPFATSICPDLRYPLTPIGRRKQTAAIAINDDYLQRQATRGGTLPLTNEALAGTMNTVLKRSLLTLSVKTLLSHPGFTDLLVGAQVLNLGIGIIKALHNDPTWADSLRLFAYNAAAINGLGAYFTNKNHQPLSDFSPSLFGMPLEQFVGNAARIINGKLVGDIQN